MPAITPAPLFVLGAPRSGTSALYKALCLHPDAAWFSNWERRVPWLTAAAAVNRLAAAAPVTRRNVWFGADGGSAYAYGRQRTIVDRVFPQPVEGEPIFTQSGVPAVSAATVPTARQRRLCASLARRRRWCGGRVFVSKRIAHNTRIPLLRALFPEARFLVIARDGRAVAASLARVDWWKDSDLWWCGVTPRQCAENGGHPLEVCARHWVEEVGAIERGLAGAPEGTRMDLTYEQFVRDPHSLLHAAAEFAGLGRSAHWEVALRGVRFPDQNDAWRERLGSALPIVERVQAAELQRLGYR